MQDWQKPAGPLPSQHQAALPKRPNLPALAQAQAFPHLPDQTLLLFQEETKEKKHKAAKPARAKPTVGLSSRTPPQASQSSPRGAKSRWCRCSTAGAPLTFRGLELDLRRAEAEIRTFRTFEAGKKEVPRSESDPSSATRSETIGIAHPKVESLEFPSGGEKKGSNWIYVPHSPRYVEQVGALYG